MIHPPSSQSTAIVLLVLGLASVALVTIDSPFRTLGLAFGFLFLVVGAGILGKTGRFSRQLRPFVNQKVRVAVWGAPLPGLSDEIFHVDAVESLGFGLWIRLRPLSGVSGIKLKIAQPTTLALSANTAEVGFAGYAQWDSRRIKGPDGRRAPGTVVVTVQ